MAPQKIKSILDEIARAMNAWTTEALINNQYKLGTVALKASINIILYAGKNDEKIYIGPWHICDQLNKSCPGGRVFRCHRSWCWQKEESFENIEAVLGWFPVNKILRFKFNNQPEMEALLWEILGRFETVIPFNFEDKTSVIGSWNLCQRLRHRFGGAVVKVDGHHWIWAAEAKHRVVTDYIAQVRKFTRHYNGILYDPRITDYYKKLKPEKKVKKTGIRDPFFIG